MEQKNMIRVNYPCGCSYNRDATWSRMGYVLCDGHKALASHKNTAEIITMMMAVHKLQVQE